MNYIPFPRADLYTDQDLIDWIAKKPKKANDWGVLKPFLFKVSKVLGANDGLPKCWYSELPQGDNYALDVEHFRPKKSGEPLTVKQINEIEKFGGIKFEQDTSSCAYHWMEFEYRNYRLVSATPNRAGAKHIYFPVATNTKRLISGEFPWLKDEFCYFLDPTDPLDASLLFVNPQGEIIPATPKTQLTKVDFDALPNGWRNNGFNYLRSVVTIKLYRLDEPIFINGRKKVYADTVDKIETIELAIIEESSNELISKMVNSLKQMILPSAPFSLAAKSALIAYSSKNPNQIIIDSMSKITSSILKNVENAISAITIDWNRP